MAFWQDYRQCNFFCFADSITLFKKCIRKKCFLLNLHPDRSNLSIDETTSLYFFLFQKSFNAHARCTRKCFCTTKNYFWVTDWPLTKAIVVCRELRSCTCSWGHDVRSFDRRHLLQNTFKRNTFPSKLSLKKDKVKKDTRKWADIWRSANSEQQIMKWRAYCDPCTTTVFISDDRLPHEWRPPRLAF